MADQDQKQRRRDKFAREQSFRKGNHGADKARREADNRRRHKAA